MRRAVATVLAAALVAFASSRGAAQEHPRIVVFGGRDDRAAARLRAELGAIGFDVVADEHTEALSREALEHAARDASAVAAIRLVRSRAGVEAWIVDRVTGKLVLREILGADLPADADGLLSLRAVELLRASLLEVDEAHDSRGDVPASASLRKAVNLPTEAPLASTAEPTKPPSPPAAHPPAKLAAPIAAPASVRLQPAIELGPAMLMGSGGLAPMLHARIALDLQAGRLGATTWALLPVAPDHVAGPEGTVDLRVFVFAAGGRLELGPAGVPWSVPLGAGAAFSWVNAQGHPAKGGYDGREDRAFLGGPYANAGFSCAVAPSARLDASVTGGLVLPAVGVYLGQREAARFGPAFVVASVGLSFGEVNRGEASLRLKP